MILNDGVTVIMCTRCPSNNKKSIPIQYCSCVFDKMEKNIVLFIRLIHTHREVHTKIVGNIQ